MTMTSRVAPGDRATAETSSRFFSSSVSCSRSLLCLSRVILAPNTRRPLAWMCAAQTSIQIRVRPHAAPLTHTQMFAFSPSVSLSSLYTRSRSVQLRPPLMQVAHQAQLVKRRKSWRFREHFIVNLFINISLELNLYPVSGKLIKERQRKAEREKGRERERERDFCCSWLVM